MTLPTYASLPSKNQRLKKFGLAATTRPGWRESLPDSISPFKTPSACLGTVWGTYVCSEKRPWARRLRQLQGAFLETGADEFANL